MGRLPVAADFAANAKLNVVPPVNRDPPTNVLLLLHGLGDTNASFTHLAAQLRFPETACLVVQAPHPLLDLGGFHWGDDIVFDSNSGGLDADAGFRATTTYLHELVQGVLVRKCGYTRREILLFGFGQGGMAALNFAVEETSQTGDGKAKVTEVKEGEEEGDSTEGGKSGQARAEEDDDTIPWGGVVSIGAALSGSAPSERRPKLRTPVLVCAGAGDSSAVTPAAEEKLRRVLEFVEVSRYRRPGDDMPRDRGEMMPVMQFFGRRLRSVKGVPKGSVEIG